MGSFLGDGGRKIAWVLMALDYGRGPVARLVDRRAAGERQVVGLPRARRALRAAAVRDRPPGVGARGADADHGVLVADDGRELGGRDPGADARVVRDDVTAPLSARAGGPAGTT